MFASLALMGAVACSSAAGDSDAQRSEKSGGTSNSDAGVGEGGVGSTCAENPPGAPHAGDATATYDAPGQDGDAPYRQFVFESSKPIGEQLPVRWSSAQPETDRWSLASTATRPAGAKFEPSYLVYQIRASRQDIAHEVVTGTEYGSHVGMGIVRRQVRFAADDGKRDEGVFARSQRPFDIETPLAWPDATKPEGRLHELVPGSACDLYPDTRVLYMNNHGGAVRYRYFDWDRSRLGTPDADGHVTWGGPGADTSKCTDGRCLAQALYRATDRSRFHAERVEDTKADSSKIVAEAFVPLVHDPFSSSADDRVRARAELARVELMDRCLAFRPLRDDRWTYRRGAGINGFCDAQCGHDGYTLPGGLAATSSGWMFRGFGENERRLRAFTTQDAEGDTLAYATLLSDGNVGYYYVNRRLMSVFGFTFQNTDEAWHANYPSTGHNSNNDAEAQVAMFRLCAQMAETDGVVAGESLERARGWAALPAGTDDEDVGSMAARIVSPHDERGGVASVCESACRGAGAGRPTRETGWRNAKGIAMAKTNAWFSYSEHWPEDELSNTAWFGDDVEKLWETRRVYAYKKRVAGVTSGPFLLDNAQAADVPRNPHAGHFAYRTLVHALDPASEDESGTFVYTRRTGDWPASGGIGPKSWHPMNERTYFDRVFQAVVRNGAPADTSSIWIANDGDLTGAQPAGTASPYLSADGDVTSCQAFVGRELPVSAGARCKIVRGM